MSTRQPLSRRSIFRSGGGLAAGVALASFSSLFATSGTAQAADNQDSVETILNLAATAETLAVTHYYLAIQAAGALGLETEDVIYLRAALDSELQHLEFLNANGGKTLTDKFYVPAAVFTNKDVFVQVTDSAELAFTGAYLAATRRFAELGNPRLAATAAQVACVEQTHKALIRDIGNRLIPNNVSLAQPIFYNVSDAVPVLAPFLNGGDGFIGPATYPGAAAVRALMGDTRLITVPPFTAFF
jgi:hypothetical protein